MSASSASQGDTAPLATSAQDSDVRTEDGVQPWIRWAGLAFVVLFLVGWILATFTWEDGANDQEVVDWYASSGNRVRQIVGGYLVTMAALAFVVFSNGLGELVPRARISRLVRALSQLFATLLAAGTVAIITVSASVEIPGLPEVDDPALLRTVESVGFGMVLLGGLLSAGAVVVVASFGLRGTGILPSWLIVAGYIGGAGLIIGGVFYIPVILLVLWTGAVALTARPAPGPVAS